MKTTSFSFISTRFSDYICCIYFYNQPCKIAYHKNHFCMSQLDWQNRNFLQNLNFPPFPCKSYLVNLNRSTNQIAGVNSLRPSPSTDLSTLRAFEQGGIFIVPHLLWHGASVFPVSSEGLPHSVASYDTRGDVVDVFTAGDADCIWGESKNAKVCLIVYRHTSNFSIIWRLSPLPVTGLQI
jgi:hypothetical protein